MTSINSIPNSYGLAADTPLDAKTLSDTPPDGVDSITWNLSSPTERADLMRSYSTSDYHDIVVIAPDEDADGGSWSGGAGFVGGGTGGGAGSGGGVGGVGGVGGGIGPATPSPPTASDITKAGGTADANDVIIVTAEVAKLPAATIQALSKAGVTIVAARGSVTDYAPELKGQAPRGWPPGSTWDNVPGAYLPDKKVVVIAVTGHGTPTGPQIPTNGQGHGSQNLVGHETAHAIDAISGADRNSSSAAFQAAYNTDLANLTAYEKQTGAAGLAEAYAESAARYYGGNHGGISTPALDAYWAANPLGGK